MLALFLLSLLLPFLQAGVPGRPIGSIGASQYVFTQDVVSWDLASAACSAIPGSLVTLHQPATDLPSLKIWLMIRRHLRALNVTQAWVVDLDDVRCAQISPLGLLHPESCTGDFPALCLNL